MPSPLPIPRQETGAAGRAAETNAYLAYKRDERYILFWLIDTWNSIIAKKNDPSLERKTTGKATVSGILAMSELFAAQASVPGGRRVPDIVYRLFRSVISSRRAALAQFQQLVSMFPDDEMKQSNQTHRVWAEAIKKAYETLGGKAWEAASKSLPPPAEDVDELDLQLEIVANRFSTLTVEGLAEVEASSDEAGAEDAGPRPTQKRQTKKGKGGKKKKGPKKPKAPVQPEQPRLDLPWESYRIVEDAKTGSGEGLMTDYLLAAYGFARQWTDLRMHLQSVWREVAHDGLNTAIAATVTKIAVAMIKRTEAAISIDFPGNEGFDAIIQAITRGDVEGMRKRLRFEMYQLNNDHTPQARVQASHIDVKEQFLVHTYHDLLDFLYDFQKNRNGKPTKAMAANLGQWNPDLDLKRATKDERIAWRRSYTINWLYDMVNVFSHVVVQRNTLHGESHQLDKVDWSMSGPWNQHRRIFGLQEFAGAVTSLAFQKQGGGKSGDIRHKVTPHLVFELTCIVDSMCVTSGWSVTPLAGHIVTPREKGFRARRDVDMFLDRKSERTGYRGLYPGMIALEQFMQGNLPDSRIKPRALKSIRDDFVHWLGEAQYMHGLDTIPPSRFSSTSTNGLNDYSPYLCGAGLAEGLQIVYRVGATIWDSILEPLTLMHLHHMLVVKGYLKPVGLYVTLSEFFSRAFFGADSLNGVPELEQKNFLGAFIRGMATRKSEASIRQARRQAAREADDLMDMMSLEATGWFNKNKSLLAILHDASWDPERIPDAELPISAVYSASRIGLENRRGNTEKAKEMAKRWDQGNSSSEDTPLESFSEMVSGLVAINKERLEGVPRSPKEHLPGSSGPQHINVDLLPSGRQGTKQVSESLSEVDILTILQRDLESDICGDGVGLAPYSSFNYFFGTCQFLALWNTLETKLRAQGNDLYVRAYERREATADMPASLPRPFRLTWLALDEQEDQCLKTMAEVFEQFRAGFLTHSYWESYMSSGDVLKRLDQKSKREEPTYSMTQCSLM